MSNYALAFDGVNDRVEITPFNLTGTNWYLSFTFEVVSAGEGFYAILNGNFRTLIYAKGDGLLVTRDSGNNAEYAAFPTTNGQIDVGIYFVEIIRDNTNNAIAYVDSVEVGQSGYVREFNFGVGTTEPTHIGAGWRVSSSDVYYQSVLHDMYFEQSGTPLHHWQPDASNGTGYILKDTVGTNDGTLIGYANDYSQWLVLAGAGTAPVANAGGNKINIAAGSTVTLDFSGSTDDTGITSYSVTQDTGDVVTLSGTGSSRTYTEIGRASCRERV